MTEAEAKKWISQTFGSEAADDIARFLAIVIAENERQNLIASSTIEKIWTRHAVDSAQLVTFAPVPGAWLDVGTGGGFPGMVVALLRPTDFTIMVEPRRRRADFLRHCAAILNVAHRVEVLAAKVEHVEREAAVISARAVSSIEKLLHATAHCATPSTRWVLPRGRIEPDRMALDERYPDKMFHMEHSLTDEKSIILVVENNQ